MRRKFRILRATGLNEDRVCDEQARRDRQHCRCDAVAAEPPLPRAAVQLLPIDDIDGIIRVALS
jgi:hypothetical protein